MCEANVYINRQGQEELVMEKVDRIIPGDENNLFMENIFGERRVVQARIKEMQLVHHRIILEEIKTSAEVQEQEIWLTLDTEHGHFHTGEEIHLILAGGYNMKSNPNASLSHPQVFMCQDGQSREYPLELKEGLYQVNLGKEADGLLQIYARDRSDRELYAKILVEVGHHHHHDIEPVGLPLEIIPSHYQHARMGENYEIKVLKNGLPLTGAKVRATYSGTSNRDYPHILTTDAQGKTSLFLTARGNYLFSLKDGEIISTFTLTKSF
ncbi:MAG: CooT family nickel-binding protein [Syntrophomonadaceae bacterium]|nr:CooT family nickel-binding protein [Syntrophomonadaceae bacterium]